MTAKAKGNTVNLVFTGEYAEVLTQLKAAAEMDERPLSQFILRYLRFSIAREKEMNPAEVVARATVTEAQREDVVQQKKREMLKLMESARDELRSEIEQKGETDEREPDRQGDEEDPHADVHEGSGD